MVRARDLQATGLTRQDLYRLRDRGLLQQVGRGLFRAPEAPPSPHQALAEVCARVPQGVICLLSALRVHEIGTQLPGEVWVALPRGAWQPRVNEWAVRFCRFGGAAYSEGIERRFADGVEIRVYSVAKTVVDCFKYRNKIGLDVALEALRAARRKKACTYDQLWACARVCRVRHIMLPYLEAMDG